jgi:hypothetical protein
VIVQNSFVKINSAETDKLSKVSAYADCFDQTQTCPRPLQDSSTTGERVCIFGHVLTRFTDRRHFEARALVLICALRTQGSSVLSLEAWRNLWILYIRSSTCRILSACAPSGTVRQGRAHALHPISISHLQKGNACSNSMAKTTLGETLAVVPQPVWVLPFQFPMRSQSVLGLTLKFPEAIAYVSSSIIQYYRCSPRVSVNRSNVRNLQLVKWRSPGVASMTPLWASFQGDVTNPVLPPYPQSSSNFGTTFPESDSAEPSAGKPMIAIDYNLDPDRGAGLGVASVLCNRSLRVTS